MRSFEALLLLTNFLSLGLSVPRQPRVAWLGIAGANLFVFFLHAVVEGLRYQLVFSYVFVMLLTVIALLQANRKSERKTPKALKIMGAGLSFVLLGLTTFLAYALPVFTLPQPTGNFAVGIQYFHWIDENRLDPFLDPSTKKRELMVKVYYPAQEDRSRPFSAYFHGSRQLLRALTTGYGMPYFLFDHLTLVKTHSKENLPIADQQAGYPVILFSHGAGTSMEVQTSQSEDLASHGYIVVAIDHTYTSAATAFPDRLVSSKEATTNFDTPEPAEVITQIMADDASFVIDQLTQLNAGNIDSVFQGRLDLEDIGAIGHSVGGAVAYNLAINDERVKAAMDLDGVVFITPQADPGAVTPFLMLANDKYHVQSIEARTPLMKRFDDMDEIDQKITIEIYGNRETYDAAYDRAQQNLIGLAQVLKSSGNLFTIEGSDHMKFTDIGLFIGIPQLREVIHIGGKTEPVRCLEITQALTRAFFDQHLKGAANIFEALLNKYPELKQVHLQ